MGSCVSTAREADQTTHVEDVGRPAQSVAHTSRSVRRKILLLGSGESGKSTILKQMKIIHQNGYTPEERLAFRSLIVNNLLECLRDLIHMLDELELEPLRPEDEASRQRLRAYAFSGGSDLALDAVLAKQVIDLWNDDIISSLTRRSSEFYLMDSASYFFEHSHRIGQEDYVPTEEDVLHARAKSTGVADMRFNIGQLSIHMLDVGGERSERKRWTHAFAGVAGIIFCTSLSEYDQVLPEDKQQNRMTESIALFDSIVNSRWFRRTPFILFLNKIDTFKRKLPIVPMESFFSDYTGGPDVNKGTKYVLWRFMQTNRARVSVYPHITQATDTANIRLVFVSVKDTILRNVVQEPDIL